LEFYAHFPVDTPLFARLPGGFPFFFGVFQRTFLTHCECRLAGGIRGSGEIGLSTADWRDQGLSISPSEPTHCPANTLLTLSIAIVN